MKPGIRVSLATVSRYGPKTKPDPSQQQRWITDCRELLDHVVVLNENHLRRLLREYAGYYNDEPVHTSIGDAPNERAVESRPTEHAKVVGLPRVGGLHHRYRWRTAA